jgi:hypothetical protein
VALGRLTPAQPRAEKITLQEVPDMPKRLILTVQAAKTLFLNAFPGIDFPFFRKSHVLIGGFWR